MILHVSATSCSHVLFYSLSAAWADGRRFTEQSSALRLGKHTFTDGFSLRQVFAYFRIFLYTSFTVFTNKCALWKPYSALDIACMWDIFQLRNMFSLSLENNLFVGYIFNHWYIFTWPWKLIFYETISTKKMNTSDQLRSSPHLRLF